MNRKGYIWDSKAWYLDEKKNDIQPSVERLNTALKSIHHSKRKKFNVNLNNRSSHFAILKQNIEKRMLATITDNNNDNANNHVSNSNSSSNSNSNSNSNESDSKSKSKWKNRAIANSKDKIKQEKIDRALNILHKMAINCNDIPSKLQSSMLKCFETKNISAIVKLHYLKNNTHADYTMRRDDWDIFKPIGPGFFTNMSDKLFRTLSFGQGSTMGAVIFNRMLFWLERAGTHSFHFHFHF